MPDFAERELLRLLDLLYDAALDPQRWPAFLDTLGPALGAACGVMHTFDVPTGTLVAFDSFGSDPEYIASYGKHYGYINPYPTTIGFENLEVGKPVLASDFAPADVVERSEFYNDWMKPQGITHDHIAVSLACGSDRVTLLSIAPHASVYRRDRRNYQRRLALLVPHLVRAVSINRTALQAHRAEAALANSLDAVSFAAFLLDQQSRLLIANARGEAILRYDRVFVLDRFKRLAAADPALDASFAAAITRAAVPKGGHMAPPVRLTSRATGRAFVAWALPMRPRLEQNGRMQLAGELSGSATVLVLVAAADVSLSIPAEAIAAAFDLSAAEARLASALVAGRTLAEYARVCGLSRNTVRNQLASVLAKTGLHRQSELVTLIAGTLGTLAKR